MNTNNSSARPSDIQLIIQHLFRFALPGMREGAKSVRPPAPLARSEHGRTRRAGSLRRTAAASLFLLAGLAPVAAQAQTSTLISNNGQANASPVIQVGFGSQVAQQFTTGGNAGGYTLSEVVIDVKGQTVEWHLVKGVLG